MEHQHTNDLVHETSPYLLQHAHNPVNWKPWSLEAIEQARREDKLIFLSIGYAACHWCHVMEHESFEDEAVAEALNRDFVSIKVDREERPDLDEIYMTATMLFTGQGGWPMSVFLMPDLTPVYAGTYFPKEDAYGRPGFQTVLAALAKTWKEDRERLLTNRERVITALQQIHSAGEGEEMPSGEDLRAAAEKVWRAFDSVLGGVSSGSNKFPPSLSMDFLLRIWRRTGHRPFLDAVETTLEQMGQGGIYDHLGGGIHRYSTDPKWRVPHFEKMLYDQGLVASVYLDGMQATGREDLKKLCAGRARGICEYVLRELRSPEGAFYSSEDADSEGLEGKFYLWTKEQIEQALEEDAAAVFCSHYGVTEVGNWMHPGDSHVPHGPKNILYVSRTAEQIAKLENRSLEEIERILDEGRRKLFELRQKRVRPGLDDKILSGWNGLMITALAKASAVLAEPRYAKAASEAASFVLDRMRQDGRLLATYGKGQARLTAYATDYAFLIEGLLALYQASGAARWLNEAEALTETFLQHYWDEEQGGFFFTADDHEELLVRSKTANDGAIPSGNSVMLMNLLALAVLLDRKDYWEKAEQMIRLFGGPSVNQPLQHERVLCGIDAWQQRFAEIALVGPAEDEGTRELAREIYRHYLPNKMIVPVDPAAEPPKRRLPLTEGRGLLEGRPAAYVCRNYTCQRPTSDPGELAQLLEEAVTARPMAHSGPGG